MTRLTRFVCLAIAALAVAEALPVAAQPIRIGELNRYKTFPAFLEPYKKGMELALSEINAAGGVLGRPLEIVVRDDNGNPGDAVRVAEELLSREKVAVLMGTFASNVGLAVADLARFVREGELRGLFRDRPVFNLLGGEPEYLDPLKEEAPVGWWVTGYPWYGIDTIAHKRFRDAYQAKFNDYPRLGSVVGYSAVNAVAAAIAKAGSTDTEKLVAALNGLTYETPFGKVTFRPLDHQSTMGAYVGRTTVKDGKGVMVEWRYADGKDFLPSDDAVKRRRPPE